MIFLHFLLGIIFSNFFGNYLFLLGAILPDIDHIYVIHKNKFSSLKEIVDSIKHEEKFGIRYKTPFIHSFFGLFIFSGFVSVFNAGAPFFALGYFSHLLLDLIDTDEKYYLFPLQRKFKGFLPVWSLSEKILTGIAAVLMLLITIL